MISGFDDNIIDYKKVTYVMDTCRIKFSGWELKGSNIQLRREAKGTQTRLQNLICVFLFCHVHQAD